MSRIHLRLVANRKTGKKDIHIDFESDPDALPIEHERDHRRLVEQLIGRKLLTAEELGDIAVTRSRPASAGERTPGAEEPPRIEGEKNG